MVLKVIEEFITKNGFSPIVKEIREEVGIKPTVTADTLAQSIEYGLLKGNGRLEKD